MQIDLFMLHLREFFDTHGISKAVDARVEKCFEEDKELQLAYDYSDIEGLKNEALDRLITALALLDSLGVKCPLFAAYQKLVEVAARPEYKRMRGEP